MYLFLESFIFSHLNVLRSSYSILFLPTSAFQCVYVIPNTRNDKSILAERRKGLLPVYVLYTSVQASEIA